MTKTRDGSSWGAMGVTYKAFDVDLRGPVTLKVISEKYLGDEAELRFSRGASFRHSNCILEIRFEWTPIWLRRTFESLILACTNYSRIGTVLVSEICRDSNKSELRMIFDSLLAKGLASNLR